LPATVKAGLSSIELWGSGTRFELEAESQT
jgi:hypothetical protein